MSLKKYFFYRLDSTNIFGKMWYNGYITRETVGNKLYNEVFKIMDVKKIAVIGATPETLKFGYDEEHPDAIALKRLLAESILCLIENGCGRFICSLCEGVELWSAEVCAAIMADGSPIELICVPTSEEQANRWHPQVRERYFRLLEHSTDVVYAKLDEEDKVDEETRTAAEAAACDRYILENADAILAVGQLDERGLQLIYSAKERRIAVIER